MAAKTTSALIAAIFTIAGATGAALAQNATPATDAVDQNSSGTPAAEQAAKSIDTTTHTATAPVTGAGTSAPQTEQAKNAAEPVDADKPDSDVAADGPAAGKPAMVDQGKDSEPQVGTYYAKQTYGDWALRCIKTAKGHDPCELYQLMRDAQGTAVAEATLIPLLDNAMAAAGATLVTPLETDLMHGILMKVDSGKSRGYPFSFCASVGCVSRMGFTQEELLQLKRGNKAIITILPYGAPEKDAFNLDLSLKGFTAGFDDLTGIAKQLQAKADEARKADAPVN